jgi:hypothetical protein
LAAVALRNPKDAAARAAVVRAAAHAAGRPRADNTAPLNQYEQHAQAFLEEIAWVSGMDAEQPGAVPPAVAALDTLPGEMSADELLRVSAGEMIPGLAEELAQPLPPPRKEKRPILLGECPTSPAPPPGAGSPPAGPGATRSKGNPPS